ncbi:MAG: hypothetical protein A2V90_07905 [Gammaproteobacteria bacterium RBG_16_57_12]|nr:MAG: hypothetical protein A2V90_07905 [Gammaproteobacteria bacterium RBG_16_57_12]
MQTRLFKVILLLVIATVLSACQNNKPVLAGSDKGGKSGQTMTTDSPYYSDDGSDRLETITVLARGYGSPPKKYYPEGQRKLMAMRAARLDAYRVLAEQISGLHIWGGTTVGDMVVEKDQFEVFLEAYVLGAKVLDVNELDNGVYEAVIEATVDQDFLRRILSQRAVENRAAAIPENAPAESVEKESPSVDTAATHYDETLQPNFYFSNRN